jgi:hypothetical protein
MTAVTYHLSQRGKLLLDKVTLPQIEQKFHAFYGVLWTIAVFKEIRQLSPLEAM